MLSGNLDAFALPDVLRFVAGGKLTGRIEITREELAGEIVIDEGRFVGTKLAEDEAPSTVDEALDVAVLLFDGSGGGFVVETEEWVGGPLDLDADELIAAVERRRQEWAEVVSVLGSLEDPLVLVGDLPDGTPTVTITASQWKLLALIDGRRSVQNIAHDSANSVYATGLALAEMAKQGMVAGGWAGASDEVEPDPVPEKGGRPTKKKKAPDPDPDPAEALHELAEDDEDDEDDDPVDDEAADATATATVRPIRPPTREEQRLRLRQ